MTNLPLHIGSQRELFIDDFLVDQKKGIELRLQHPIPREISIDHDEPWEGNGCGYHTVFKDGDLFRMYYRGAQVDLQSDEDTHEEVICYAESRNGIDWEKPELRFFDFGGSKKNNIVWKGSIGGHVFVPFKDTNPHCAPDSRYKALAASWPPEGPRLYACKSEDGIHWSLLQDDPIMTEGYFDSQNLAFWDENLSCYVAYFRDFKTEDNYPRPGHGIPFDPERHKREIRTSTSSDFVHWSPSQWLQYINDSAQIGVERQFYTNQIIRYYRAPHIWVGFPMRYIYDRIEFDGCHDGLSDCVFMTSRDGIRFSHWDEAFIRPGLQKARWINRNNQTAWGILETASALPGTPNELSLYSNEGYLRGDSCQLRRYTLRLDGFVSAQATLSGGELLTKPLTFDGTHMLVNYSTSAAGNIYIEILDAGKQTPLAHSEVIYGDDVGQRVPWEDGAVIEKLANRPVRLRFELKDADLYSFQFVRSDQ
jgi:hypothetical protein